MTNKEKGPGTIELILLFFGIFSMFSAAMWAITVEGDTQTWFSRFSVGLIAIGLSGVISEIRKGNELKRPTDESPE